MGEGKRRKGFVLGSSPLQKKSFQVGLPEKVRDLLKTNAGDEIEFIYDEDDKIVIIRKQSKVDY